MTRTNARQAALLTGRVPHLYVTRAASLAYQHLTGVEFEEARRALTTRILSSARPHGGIPGGFTLAVQTPRGMVDLLIWTRVEGSLRVVVRVASAEREPDAQPLDAAGPGE
jgi:hypothetical protein